MNAKQYWLRNKCYICKKPTQDAFMGAVAHYHCEIKSCKNCDLELVLYWDTKKIDTDILDLKIEYAQFDTFKTDFETWKKQLLTNKNNKKRKSY